MRHITRIAWAESRAANPEHYTKWRIQVMALSDWTASQAAQEYERELGSSVGSLELLRNEKLLFLVLFFPFNVPVLNKKSVRFFLPFCYMLSVSSIFFLSFLCRVPISSSLVLLLSFKSIFSIILSYYFNYYYFVYCYDLQRSFILFTALLFPSLFLIYYFIH